MTILASDVLLILVAIVFPPGPVAWIAGICSLDTLIAVILTLIGLFPGHIWAFYTIYKYIRARETYGLQGFVYVGQGRYEPVLPTPVSSQPTQAPAQQGQVCAPPPPDPTLP